MTSDVSIAIVTAGLGLLTAGILAVLNNWITLRAGIDENLRAQRLAQYPGLWAMTAAASRWPRATVTRGALEELHRTLRSWYYGKGGLFLSRRARDRYGDYQELIAALLAAKGTEDAGDVLAPACYSSLMEAASALRTALTDDLDTRRKRSVWDNRRRSRWHTDAAQAAEARLTRTKSATTTEIWLPAPSGERPGEGSATSRS